jgi:hypothetical protein
VLGTTLDTFSHVRHLGDVRNTCPRYTFLTLPLTKESVPHHSQLISEGYKLASSQSLSEDFHYLFISGYKLKLNYPSLNIVPDEVISNIDVFRLVMKNWNLIEFYATLIVKVNHVASMAHQISQPTTCEAIWLHNSPN